MKAVEKVNAVTRTYKAGCNLMILPQSFVDSMYMVHAHHDGYSEILSRVSRENDGYVPIKELQRQIECSLRTETGTKLLRIGVQRMRSHPTSKEFKPPK